MVGVWRKRQKRHSDEGPSAALVDGETDQPAIAPVGGVLLLPVHLSTAGSKEHSPRRAVALADTGSCLSLMHQNLAEEFIQAGAPTRHAQVTATSVTGDALRVNRQVQVVMHVHVCGRTVSAPTWCCVSPRMPKGADVLLSCELCVNVGLLPMGHGPWGTVLVASDTDGDGVTATVRSQVLMDIQCILCTHASIVCLVDGVVPSSKSRQTALLSGGSRVIQAVSTNLHRTQ